MPYYITKLCEIKYQTTDHNSVTIKQLHCLKQTERHTMSVNLNNQRHIAKHESHESLNTEISTSRNVLYNWLQKQSVLAWTGFSRLSIGPKVSVDEQGRQLFISRIIISSNSWHDAVERKLNLLSNYLTTVKRQERTASGDTDHDPNYFIPTLQKAVRNITDRSYVGDVTTWSQLQCRLDSYSRQMWKQSYNVKVTFYQQMHLLIIT